MLNIPAVILAFIYGGLFIGGLVFLLMRKRVRRLEERVMQVRLGVRNPNYLRGYFDAIRDWGLRTKKKR